MQLSAEPEATPEPKEHRVWKLYGWARSDGASGVTPVLEREPYNRGHVPTGAWPTDPPKHTIIGSMTKAAYKFDVIVYDWLGRGTRQYFSGIGHSWAALEVANRQWIRNEAILEDGDPDTDSGEFTSSRIKWQRPTASGSTSWREAPAL